MNKPPGIRAGMVSVILVNYRGADDTVTCLRSFAGVDWPADRLELLVVDNASGDGSAERIRAQVPGARVIQSDVNGGFAGGCNLGAAEASGEYLAFINNDARPGADWITAAVEVLDTQADVAAVASKVLDWEGERIDFVDGSLTWYGMGYKRECEQPDTGEWDKPKDVLFATGAAMFVRAGVYRAVEGFDDRYFMFYEDVDLGWRLNLLGWRVRYVPTSVAFHRHHASMKSYGPWREHYLLERNALFSMYKNLGDDLLAKALPAALLLAVRRGLSRGDADNTILDLSAAPPSGPEEDTVAVSRETLAPVFAIDALVDQLSSLDEDRRRLQSERRRSDTELLPLFRRALEPAYAHPRYEAAHRILVDAFGIERAFSTRRKIVIATGETLSARMAGPAIRAWAMADALAAEHDVELVTTGTCTITNPRFSIRSVGLADMRGLERWCDIFVFQGLILSTFRWLIDSDKILIADIYNPFHLEQLEQAKDQGAEGRARTVSDCTTALNDQLTRGDFFLCASDKQRDFWLGQLSAVGRINPKNYDADETMGSLIAVAPFGVPDAPPVHTRQALKGVVPGIGVDDKVILWGGGIYNWFDPITLLHAIDRLRHRRPDVRLFFLGLKHPNPDVPEMRMAVAAQALSDSLGLTDKHVFFNEGWVDYDDRQNYLLEADIGVSTHLDHVETAFSFRTRILDYLWTCLPIVATGGDTFADLIESKGLGITVPPGDVDSLEDALFRLLDDQAASEACRARLAEVMPNHTWSRVLAPVVEFCRAPRRAADLAAPLGYENMSELAVAVSRRPRLRADVALAREYFRAGGPVEVARRASQRLVRYGAAVGRRLSE
ncbi:MAG TPA: glycosyltransferase [Acidimicrobiales bacterium]|nr:glycosyltransferase [Acidimicrobiales bacterium]